MKKSAILLAAATGVFLLVAALLWSNVIHLPSNSSVSGGMHASLRLKWLYDPGFAGELVAAKGGLFERHGLMVDIRPGGFDSDPIKLVASGADTIGVAGADSFLLARAKGVPIVAFAAGYLQTGVAYYARQDSGIHTPSDFIGHRVGYQAGQDTGTIYEALIKKLGVDRSRITEIPVKFDFAPFLSGQVDVWPGYAATQSYILSTKHVPYVVIVPSTFGLRYLGTVYFAREDTIKNNPKLIQAFVDGLIDGWELTYADYSKAIPLISAYDPQNLTPDLIRWNLDKQKDSILPAGTQYTRFSMAQWRDTENTLVAQGLLAQPVDLSTAVTMQFLDSHYAH
jgi:NitT/TauT family transport system substrate-binding protein